MKKMMTLLAAALIALGVVGFGYAAWTESVDIQASVTTGNLDFRIENILVLAANGATITPVKTDDYTWTVTVLNTYPGWEGQINVLHRNAGTVTLRYESFQVVDWSGPTYLRDNYKLKFYDPSDNVNYEKTLTYLTTKRTYDDEFGTAFRQYVTLTPTQGQWSKIGLKLGDISGYENTAVTFTFRMWATQAVP